MRLKTDSFVVETDVHFPTDYNLLWYSARKCIDIAEKLPVGGWRKSNHWKRSLKGLMRATGKTSVAGGPNKKRQAKSQRRVWQIPGGHQRSVPPDGRLADHRAAGRQRVGPGHLWVHDDTEVVTKDGKAHLALSTDAYSRKLIGYSWSRQANSEHVERALTTALTGHVHGPMSLIHHSDNGSIYGSKAYQLLLKQAEAEVSWSPPGRPDRNPITERMNLTFKQEYLCDAAGKTFEQIKRDLPVYIRHYNEDRPHMS